MTLHRLASPPSVARPATPVLGQTAPQAVTQAGVKPAEQQAAQKLRSSVSVHDLDAFLQARAGRAPAQRGLVPGLRRLLGASPPSSPPSAQAVALHQRLGEAVTALGAIYADGLVTEGELAQLQQARGKLRSVLGLADPAVLDMLPKDVRARLQDQLLEPLAVLDQAATRRADRVFAQVAERDEAALRQRLGEQPLYRQVDPRALLQAGLTPFSLPRYQPGDFVGVPRSDGSVDKGVVVGRDDDPPGLRVEVLDRRTDSLGLKTLSPADVAQANPLKIGDYVEAPGMKLWVTGVGPGGVVGTVQDARGQVRTVDAAFVARIAIDVARAAASPAPAAPAPAAPAHASSTASSAMSSRASSQPSSGRPASSTPALARAGGGGRAGEVGGAGAVAVARSSRQSLQQALDAVWRDKGAFLAGTKSVYSDVYNAVVTANPLTRGAGAFLDDVAGLARGRPAGSVSNTQSFGGGGDALTDVVAAWKDGSMPATGTFGRDKLERTFFRFERPDWQPDAIRQRVYLNAAADHATDVMRFVVRQIVDDPARFPGVEMAKLSGPAAVGERSENIVVYTRDDDATRRVLDAVAAWRASHADHFRDDTPAFTEAVAPGVATGDEPAVGGGRLSFGSLRAQVITAALQKAEQQGLDRAGFGRLVDEGLRAMQVDPGRPHRNLDVGGR
jgi:hypothetical protein